MKKLPKNILDKMAPEDKVAYATHKSPRPTIRQGVSTDEAKLNKTEQAYLQFLREQKLVWIGIQNVTLKLAHDCRFTPDFVTIDSDGEMCAIDVKGFMRDDALVKIKVAARLFPWMEFRVAYRSGDWWDEKTIEP